MRRWPFPTWATLRARAGYAVGSFLPYMFGGVALGRPTSSGPPCLREPVQCELACRLPEHSVRPERDRCPEQSPDLRLFRWARRRRDAVRGSVLAGTSGNMSASPPRSTPLSIPLGSASATNSDRDGLLTRRRGRASWTGRRRSRLLVCRRPDERRRTMKIYGDSNSGNCLKVKWVCDRLKLPYSWVRSIRASARPAVRNFSN